MNTNFAQFLFSGRCKEHYNKYIFQTKEHALLYAEYISTVSQRPYPCPVDRTHFHLYSATKRRVRKRKKARLKKKEQKE